MSVDNFIPAVWSGTALRILERNLVYASDLIINRDYEGDIKEAGDQVRINTIGEVTISTYTPNSNMTAAEELSSSQLALVVDQFRNFNFQVDDVDKRQAKGDFVEKAMKSAAYGLKKAADSYVGALYSDIATANTQGTEASPISLATATDAYDKLVQMKVDLDETETPEEGRFVVVPPWFEGKMLVDSRFVTYGGNAQDDRLTNGRIGRAAGFEIFKTNQVPSTTSTTGFKIIAGWKGAWSFASQLLETVAYTPELRFSDAMKGLYVYGAKVVRPANLALLIANP